MKYKEIRIRRFQISIVFFLLVFLGCGVLHREGMHAHFSQRKTGRVAVLDFEEQGFLNGEKLGGFMADELTASLFMKKKVWRGGPVPGPRGCF